jgi:hypothetical protein
MICPCCHRDMPEEELQRMERKKAASGPVQARILEKLERSTGFVTGIMIADFVYADERNGGPDSAVVVISQAVKLMNPRLRALGWQIRGRGGPGGGYQLERLHG